MCVAALYVYLVFTQTTVAFLRIRTYFQLNVADAATICEEEREREEWLRCKKKDHCDEKDENERKKTDLIRPLHVHLLCMRAHEFSKTLHWKFYMEMCRYLWQSV